MNVIRIVIYPTGSVFSEYPDAAVELIVRPPVGAEYQGEILRSGTTVIWAVDSYALQNAGEGVGQLRFTAAGEVVSMSPIARIRNDRAIG